MHHLSGIDLTFGVIEEQGLGVLESKVGEFGCCVSESFFEICNGGEKDIEAVAMSFAEYVGGLVGDELVSAEGLVVEDRVGDAGSEFLESLIATVDEVLNFLIGENIEVVEDFSD